jgi:4-amino-4-deoxy-L-arabinose transferase-like glycosyltransferase
MTDFTDHGMSRGDIAATGVLSALTAGAAFVVYYLAPVERQPHGAVWWRLAVALAVFGVVLSHELNAILRHGQPIRRAVIALAVLLPLFVILFSWIYLVMSRSNPAAFGMRLSRTESLYFTMTVLSTVGFGDITPKTDPARLATTFQMAADLVLLAVVVRLILGVASREHARRRTQPDDSASD